MSKRITSKLNEELNYDFLFSENNKLDRNDENTKSSLHEIDIFGNKYNIAMGKKNLHPNNDNISYFICYLIYNSLVVSKIGIYEMENNDIIDLNNAEFSKMELLIDNYYYKNPESLLTYRSISINVEDDEDEKQEDEKQEDEKQEDEKQEDEKQEEKDGKEESEKKEVKKLRKRELEEGEDEEELEEGEVEEEKYSTKKLIDDIEDEPQKKGLLLEKIREIFDSKEKISASKTFNLIIGIYNKKHLLDQTFDDEFNNIVKKNDDNKAYFDKTFFNNKSQKFTKSLLTIFEYMLNIKFIIVNKEKVVQQFSIFDNIQQSNLTDFFKNSRLNMNEYWNIYNPNKIILVTKNEDDTYEYVDTIDLQAEDINSYSEILNSIQIKMNDETHEYEKVSKQKLSILKESFNK